MREFHNSSGSLSCPVAGQHPNLPISSHYQHVTGTAAAVFTCLLFLWRHPVFGSRPRGVSWYLFQRLPAWAGCKLNGDAVRALSHECCPLPYPPPDTFCFLVVSACICDTFEILQDNTEHLLHAWLMSGAIVAVPVGPMKRHERSQGSRLQTSLSVSQWQNRHLTLNETEYITSSWGMAKLLLVFRSKRHIGVNSLTQRSKKNTDTVTRIESQGLRWRKAWCVHIYVCVARVRSKSFVVHKSADSGGDVRTNRASLLQLAWTREKQERGTRRGKERAGQQLLGLHRTPVTREVSAGHCFLDTPPQTLFLVELEGGHLLQGGKKPTGRFLKNAF